MSESRNHFVFAFLVLLCCISFQNVSGIWIELTRHQNGDYFTNPYKTSPGNVNFCNSTKAICSVKDRPSKLGDQCSHCKCNAMKLKTFNEISLRCAPIQDFRQGCRAWLSDDSMKLLDLFKKGKAILSINSDKVESVRIFTINGMEDAFQINFELLEDQQKVEIKWRKVRKKMYHGRMFRVQISYNIDGRNDSRINDCFIFKSKGNITVTIPDLTTTTPLPSKSEKSIIQISPTACTARTTPSTTTTTASPTKITDSFNSTNEARNKESSDGENNAVAVSLAFVGCLLLLGVILAVLWFKRRSKRTSQDKEIYLKNRNVENPMTMSQPESSITFPDKDEDNHDYDYADGNLKNYASLDATKVERKPVYQSLINVERDLKNKHIPNESGETSTAEPFYHVVEGEDGNQHPGQIYHVLEDPEKSDNCETQDAPGMTGHENPAYSTLEEDAPETCDREVSEGTGDDNPERVYSVLEN